MRVHVAFTPARADAAPVGIVVDVLRATSTIAQALAAGYERVLCCAEIDEARELARDGRGRRGSRASAASSRSRLRLRQLTARARGEPAAATLVLSTTNGTRLLVSAAARFEHVYVGSLLNLDAVAAAARAHGEDVAVLCAGVLGELALDDAYCAGRIAAALGGDRADSATAAVRLAESYPDAAAGLGASRSAWNLRRHGLEADIEWCARENALAVVPRYAGAVGPGVAVTL